MSALGHKQTSRLHLDLSALPPKADIERHDWAAAASRSAAGAVISAAAWSASFAAGERDFKLGAHSSAQAEAFARDNCEPCGKNAVQLEAKMKRTPIRVEPISGKYFEIDSNKRSGAVDVMRHPAIKRSADRYWQSVGAGLMASTNMADEG